RPGTAPLRLLAARPLAILLRPALGALRVGQPLPPPEAALAQPLVEAHRYTDQLTEGAGGVVRAAQVRADDLHRLHPAEHLGRCGRLGLTGLVQGDVYLTLQPAAGVVVGLAVPPEQHGRGRHESSARSSSAPPGPPRASSGSSTTGQSFQSRSRA